MQQGCVKAGFAGLPVAQQRGPVQVVTKQPITVLEVAIRGHRHGVCARQQTQGRGGQAE